MIENQREPEQLVRNPTWTVDTIKERQRVIRKFINSAIYVEKEIVEMPPQRKINSLTSSIELMQDEVLSDSLQIKKVSQKGSLESGYRTLDHSSTEESERSFPSDTTIKPKETELRLSLTGLNTNRSCTLDEKERQEIVQNWVVKKELEKRRKLEQMAKLAKEKEQERQKMIEKERENFKRWLAEKKKEEERRKAQKELEEEVEKLREAEKEKKKVQNEISFNLWLRRKRKNDLEKKITEKLALLHVYEEKQKRLEENDKAYQEWLANSKNKQKPIAMNKGLQSLCSSASVTYINPIPWTPNYDPNLKSASQ